MREATRNLQHITDSLRDGKPTRPLDDGAKIFAFHKLEGDEMQSLVFAVIENARYVFVVQLRGSASLLLEATHIFGISGDLGRKNLKGNFAIQVRVSRLNDRGHPAYTEGLAHLKVRQPPTTKLTEEFLFGPRRSRCHPRDHGRHVIRRFGGFRNNGNRRVARSGHIVLAAEHSVRRSRRIALTIGHSPVGGWVARPSWVRIASAAFPLI